MNLQEKIGACQQCALHTLLPLGCRPVAGVGPITARLMIVGEALGEAESIIGEPFVGQCGQLLDKMLEKAGLKREEIYITNTVKCRPCLTTVKSNGKTSIKNRPPSKFEIKVCQSWLTDEISLVKPQVIITLGKVPASVLLGLKSTVAMSQIVGKKHTSFASDGIVIPTYHPSYLLQHGRALLEDSIQHLKLAKEYLDNGYNKVL